MEEVHCATSNSPQLLIAEGKEEEVAPGFSREAGLPPAALLCGDELPCILAEELPLFEGPLSDHPPAFAGKKRNSKPLLDV